MDNNEIFQYSYSAQQQEEIKKLRSKYAAPQEDKLQQLRRLDERVSQKADVFSVLAGIISLLVFGLGLTCCLEWGESMFVPGIITGIIGFAGMALTTPLHGYILKKERKKIAPEIIRLTDELLK